MNYPDTCATTGKPNAKVLELIAAAAEDGRPVKAYAEIGIYAGDTSVAVAHALEPGGRMQLFDFAHRVKAVEERLKAESDLTDKDLEVRLTPNTELTYDSYCWTLAKCLYEGMHYDFVYLDGAHTWHHDGMAFLLLDKMLLPGGMLILDDADWSIKRSKTMHPEIYPEVVGQYTEEQIDALQVKMVIDLLIKPDPRYVEIIPYFAYQKVDPEWPTPSSLPDLPKLPNDLKYSPASTPVPKCAGTPPLLPDSSA